MADEQPTISLQDPEYNAAVKRITAVVYASMEASGGDPQKGLSALVFVLSMLLEADNGLTTNQQMRHRAEEIAKVVREQMKWMREGREEMGEPMFHTILRDIADEAGAGDQRTLN